MNHVLYSMLRNKNIKEFLAVIIGYKQNEINEMKQHIYREINIYFNDYHIYWLHMGISEIDNKDYRSAYLHLEQARSIREGYSFEIEHAYSSLQFERAINVKDATLSERLGWFEEACEILRGQINRRENDAFTTHTFIVKGIKYYDSINEQVPTKLINEMLQYYNIAKEQYDFSKSTIVRNMFKYLYGYIFEREFEYKDVSFNLSEKELQYLAKNNKWSNKSADESVDSLELI